MSGYPSQGGLPHSDTHGSTPARGSPWLFAACHVLHRLLVPRHPPNALLILDIPRHRTYPKGLTQKGIPKGHPVTTPAAQAASHHARKPSSDTQLAPRPIRSVRISFSTDHRVPFIRPVASALTHASNRPDQRTRHITHVSDRSPPTCGALPSPTTLPVRHQAEQRGHHPSQKDRPWPHAPRDAPKPDSP